MAPKLVNVRIITMDAELEFSIHPNTTGKQLFDQVTKTLGLREVWFFGLQYNDAKNEPNWLKLNKKVTAHEFSPTPIAQSVVVAAASSGEPNANHSSNAGPPPLVFRFRAKFYPEDVATELIQEITQRMFYLQVKEAILTDEAYCPPETALLLASYAVQVKYGDHETDTHVPGFLANDRLLPARVLEQHKMSREEWEGKVMALWIEHRGMLREEAMLEYLKVAQDLEMYGVNYYEIKNKKGTDLLLGVDALGINVYEKTDMLTPRIGFPWSEVRNISFSGKKFIIKSTDRNAADFVFLTAHQRTNKQILALSMGNHELYMRRRRPDSIEVQQMKAMAAEERALKEMQRAALAREKAAREELARQRAELEERLREMERRAEQTQTAMREKADRLNEMESKLEQAIRERAELEAAQKRAEELQKRLAQEVGLEQEQRRRLQDDYERAIQEAETRARQLSVRDEELAVAKTHIDTIQREREQQLQIISSEHTRQLAELEQQQRAAAEERERHLQELQRAAEQSAAEQSATTARSNAVTNLLEREQDGASEAGDDAAAAAELDARGFENGLVPRPEEERVAYNRKDQMQSKLQEISSDLQLKVDPAKLVRNDHLNEENQRRGLDKFKTLKNIRQGNTKKRVDEFEAM